MDIGGLVGILFTIIIIACIFGVLFWLLGVLPIPEPFKGWARIAFYVVAGLVVIFFLLGLLPGGHISTFRFR